jgi:hypothetical protein
VRLITEGRNRFVLVTRRHAYKFPSLRCWRDLLFGILNNLHEAQAQRDHPAYCPVLWCSPLGLLIVMPRVDVLGQDEWREAEGRLPADTCAEMKPSSWGRLDGRIVAIDYGWPTFGWPGKG